MTTTAPYGRLLFLKLGGSLITDKSRPRTPRLDVINRLAGEIAEFNRSSPDMKLILGHGSGSFGHVPARKYHTARGVHTNRQWLGFLEVWREAATLHRLVIEAFSRAGLPVISFPPSGGVTASKGKVWQWNLAPLERALEVGLAPVVFGDVAFDMDTGGTILSTEVIFSFLAQALHPGRILLAGIEPGVWADFPACTQLLHEITPEILPSLRSSIVGSASTDVTGGMISKVELSLKLVVDLPGLEIQIFSGDEPGSVERALKGERSGTVVHSRSAPLTAS